MEQRKLLRTVETVASKSFPSFRELMQEVVDQLVENEEIKVTGGRVWKLNRPEKAYQIYYQQGSVTRIRKNYRLLVDDFPIFSKIAQKRTVLADETDEFLIKKGIFKYSASGFGSKLKIGDKSYYEYLIAVNSDDVDENLGYTLNIVATILTSKLKEKRITESRVNLLEDIDSAKRLQKSILPEHEYTFHDYQLFGVTVPARTLGGDFFDYLPIGDDEERLGITIGDAASKGIAAAAEAMYISGAIRMASKFQIKISPLMTRINEIVNKIFADDRFASFFYGEISNDRKGLFLYSNAGHNPPMFISKNGKKISYLDPTGPLLGPAPQSRYETDSLNFSTGDVLLLYSDGIVEAANNKFHFFGENRLKNVLRKNHINPPKKIAYAILDEVYKFSTEDSEYQDDKTVVIIKKIK
ncbi:MAG: serine/threonine-protein phosphatase [Melioribacteraceae bacterium]|nr:serine/threonine-protein phosphatase [Melioribacteraceae bacterium]MCF8264656.1 serine/threonine-protein phosphatase [Melioribacteraceae bacterium]MCF8412853.1 serine/threonine-protein phosphatase [Melioribacteraceae bacterium]MCF8432010.1 serine/threonine-protein phosphatase [Melioribacteraceae bacterium]